MKVYAVEGNIRHLLLVRRCRPFSSFDPVVPYVVNGGYALLRDSEGYYIPRTNFRVQYMMEAPKVKQDPNDPDIPYEEILSLAYKKLHMPLFDKF